MENASNFIYQIIWFTVLINFIIITKKFYLTRIEKIKTSAHYDNADLIIKELSRMIKIFNIMLIFIIIIVPILFMAIIPEISMLWIFAPIAIWGFTSEKILDNCGPKTLNKYTFTMWYIAWLLFVLAI